MEENNNNGIKIVALFVLTGLVITNGSDFFKNLFSKLQSSEEPLSAQSETQNPKEPSPASVVVPNENPVPVVQTSGVPVTPQTPVVFADTKKPVTQASGRSIYRMVYPFKIYVWSASNKRWFVSKNVTTAGYLGERTAKWNSKKIDGTLREYWQFNSKSGHVCAVAAFGSTIK